MRHDTGGTAVKVIHRPTGIEAEGDRHLTQVKDKLQALLDLVPRLLDDASGQGA